MTLATLLSAAAEAVDHPGAARVVPADTSHTGGILPAALAPTTPNPAMIRTVADGIASLESMSVALRSLTHSRTHSPIHTQAAGELGW